MSIRCIVVPTDTGTPQVVEFVVVPRIGERVYLYDAARTSRRYRVTEVQNVTYVEGYVRQEGDYPPLVMLILKDDGPTEDDKINEMLSMCNTLLRGAA
jgi:hypothetical protein